jgi:transposase-like protein
MDESKTSNRNEAREFWREAIRLWHESGLSVRDFCIREGLTEHTFYARRRELQPENTSSDICHKSPDANHRGSTAVGRQRRKHLVAKDASNATIASPFVELVTPSPAGLCHCTLELESATGTKMRIELRSAAMPDLAAISQSFWNDGE